MPKRQRPTVLPQWTAVPRLLSSGGIRQSHFPLMSDLPHGVRHLFRRFIGFLLLLQRRHPFRSPNPLLFDILDDHLFSRLPRRAVLQQHQPPMPPLQRQLPHLRERLHDLPELRV